MTHRTPGPLGDPPESLQTCSKNVKSLRYFLQDAILLPWPNHELGPQPAHRARKTGMKSPKYRLTTCLPRDAMNQNVKKCCPEPRRDFFRFGVGISMKIPIEVHIVKRWK